MVMVNIKKYKLLTLLYFLLMWILFGMQMLPTMYWYSQKIKNDNLTVYVSDQDRSNGVVNV